ncbi:hypothetical protein AB0M11_07160 [Streptomyces sp. NPDC051987]
MSSDPYAVLRALLRAEAVRSMPKPDETKSEQPPRPQEPEQKRG